MSAYPERSRWWKVEQSWWIVLIGVSVGFATWLGFGYIGLRLKRRAWIGWATVYLGVLLISAWLLNFPGEGWQVGVGTFGLLGCWIGGSIHALVIRDQVLDELGAQADPQLRLARQQLSRREVAGKIAVSNPALARQAGIGADPESFGGLVDVNHAGVKELSRLPGIGVDFAARIVEIRERIGGFDSVLDFANLLDLPPRLTDSIRDRLICLPR